MGKKGRSTTNDLFNFPCTILFSFTHHHFCNLRRQSIQLYSKTSKKIEKKRSTLSKLRKIFFLETLLIDCVFMKSKNKNAGEKNDPY